MIRLIVFIALAAITLCPVAVADTFSVTNTNSGGPGSLQQAILDSNAQAGGNTIVFSIPGAGVQTITPTFQSPLPAINRQVLIDGYTQPGASANTLASGDNAVVLIEISGATISNNGNAISINSGGGGSIIRGLAINRGWNAGVQIVDSSGNRIEGCFLGTDTTGLIPRSLTTGVLIEFGGTSSSNVIGGTALAARNLISGNSIGVLVRSGSNNVVQGNFIGTDATGTNALANADGIHVRSSNNLIGGSSVAARNVIAGNTGDGVVIGVDLNPPTGNQIQGNFIGMDVTGTIALRLGDAIRLNATTSNTQVGGLTATPGTPPGNVISGSFNGISVQQGANNNTIQGNLIGTTATGTVALGNTDGLNVRSASNTIGGSVAGARNVISANGRRGISLGNDGATVHDNLVQGNFIGTDISGSLLLGNGEDGVFVGDSINNTIGGIPGPGAPGNIIAGNGGNGVNVIRVFSTTGLAILGNSIFSNGRLGIDLNNDGVTPNDPGDLDEGPNHLQNFPRLNAVTNTGANSIIAGSLNSNANTTYRIEFFANISVDPSGFGEGQTFVGASNVTTNGSGNASFSVTLPQIPAGRSVTATATDPNGNTSEFSATLCFQTLARTGDVITIAGTGNAGFSGDNGQAVGAALHDPEGIVIGTDGTLYLGDASNRRIRAVNPANCTITTIAGNGTPGNTGDGGPAIAATISGGSSLAVDRSRHALYLADSGNDRVRKVDLANLTISLFAGTSTGFSGDGGPATAAQLSMPVGVTTDGTGKLSIADLGNLRIRQVNPASGAIFTVAGNGNTVSAGDGGLAVQASFAFTAGVAADSLGNFFVIDSPTVNQVIESVIRRVDSTTGVITRVAGGGATIPGTGPALTMNLREIVGIAVNDTGTTLYIANRTQIFKVDLITGQLTPFAGDGTAGFAGDGGPALAARFNMSLGTSLALAPGGGLILSDTSNQRVRFVAPDSISLTGNSQQTAFYLPWVSALTGNVSVSNNPNVSTVDLSSLATVAGAINVNGNTAATTVALSSLTTVGGDISVSGNAAATTVALSSLTMVGGAINVSNDAATSTVNLSSLTTVGGDISVNGDTSAMTVDLSSLTMVGGAINVSGDTAATTVALSSLTTVGGAVNVSNDAATSTVNLSSLTTVGGDISVSGNAAATTVALSSLTTVGGAVNVSNNASTSTVDLSSLQSAGGNVTIASNGPAVVVNLTRLQSVGGVNPATIRLQGGTVLFNSVSGFILPANASLTGSASLVGKIMSRGVISPGNSPGRFDLTGNLTLASGSELRLELGGPSPGTQHDFVSVSGSTIVGGTLTVSLINNFQSVMAPGATFTVLTSGNAITGAFSNVADGGTITTTDGYARFTVNYAGANAVRLSGLVIVDTDGDGLPDWWEDQFGFNKNNPADAQLDSDGDGVSNLNEFRAGTSPNNPASAFRVVTLARETNDMRVTWNAVGGKSYVVQATSSLTVPFVDISPLINVSGTVETTMDYVDTGVLPGTQRFYRVRLGP